MLEHDWVLAASGVMLVVEFLVDKVPGFDIALGQQSTRSSASRSARCWLGVRWAMRRPQCSWPPAILGGAITTGTHLAKTGTRAAINTSPEPLSNWTASFGEDGMLLGGLWLVFHHPAVFLVLLIAFLALTIWLLPKLFRFCARRWSRCAEPARVTATADIAAT